MEWEGKEKAGDAVHKTGNLFHTGSFLLGLAAVINFEQVTQGGQELVYSHLRQHLKSTPSPPHTQIQTHLHTPSLHLFYPHVLNFCI